MGNRAGLTGTLCEGQYDGSLRRALITSGIPLELSKYSSSWDNEGNTDDKVQLPDNRESVQHFCTFIWTNVGHIALIF